MKLKEIIENIKVTALNEISAIYNDQISIGNTWGREGWIKHLEERDEAIKLILANTQDKINEAKLKDKNRAEQRDRLLFKN